MNMFKWLRYSGASVAVTLNPLHWRWVPAGGVEFVDEWRGPNQHNWYASWVFLTVRVWIDNGSW
jgi:hypothetical protein